MNLYVGNLPFQVTQRDIEEVFAPFGKVASVRLVTDSSWRRSKGFGFVDMPNAAEAQEAIKGLHHKDYGGRPLMVAEARPRDAVSAVVDASAGEAQNLDAAGLPPPRLSPALPHDQASGATFQVGEKVTIREVKAGPRPPAPWLGKTGRIVDAGSRQEIKYRAGDHRQQYHAVQIDGVEQIQMMPQSWLRKMKRATKRPPRAEGMSPEPQTHGRPFRPTNGVSH